MTNQNAVMTTPISYEVNGEPVKLSGNTVREYLVRGNGNVSEQEVVMFMNLCKFQKLNPFLNEAYLIKFGSQPSQIIVSKEAFMKRAEANPNYKGFKAGIIVARENSLVEIEGAVKLPNDQLIGGWCEVYRKDRDMPIVSKISLDEFGKGQATWKQMPLNMIRKSAIVNALREAFPENLGAMYTEDDADLNKPSEKQVVQQEVDAHANKGDFIDIPSEPANEPTTEPVESVQGEIYEQPDIFEDVSESNGGPDF
ncbi:phage recombination protein Bet [Kurthia senegalensis]|uniref:phage recombination protein Bet n=1 Tax=Kurthia senegalensis TaxID=1033740 RepID=UPI00028A3F28|nr:phage recombination protein Bet [Kurthia senegalensis]